VVAPAAERDRLKQQYGLSESQEELKAAIAMLRNDDPDGALAEVDKILESNPDVGAAHYVRGEALRRTDAFEEAEAAFRRAMELDPSQEGVRGSLGGVLLARGDAVRAAGDEDAAEALYREALEHIDAQLALTPEDVANLTNRAVVVERIGGDADTEEVLASLEAVLEVSPDNLPARLRLANAYVGASRGAEAYALLDAAPSKDVELARAFFNVAVAEYNAGNIEAAIKAATRSAEVEPTLADPYRLLGRAYLGENRRPEAIEALKRFLEIAPAGTDTSTEQQILTALEADAAGS
jgi:tetratricopeptide (TPR) repeat protein